MMSQINTPGGTRRTFLKHAAFAGATLPLVMPRLARADSANGKLNMAAIGVGGKGRSDLANASEDQQVVALCDIDRDRLAGAGERYTDAARYVDFREMFDKHDIDACTISTPDHMHAFATMWAMNRGCHVYTQKPLTHTIPESRALARAAAEKDLVTQMGIQHHSSIGYRMTFDLLQRHVIGKVTEAHAWTNRPIWPQPVQRPAHADPVPKHVAWYLWLGVAADRPYVEEVYHPFAWRGRADFGTGAIGDMAVHILDPVVYGLGLKPPRSVRHEGPSATEESFPEKSIVHYVFDGTEHTAADPFPVTWYDGGNKPPESLEEQLGQSLGDNGSLYIGEEGMLLVNHGSGPQLLPREKFADVDRGEYEGRSHYHQWRDAVRGEDQTSAPFSYGALLTEICLLGALASRFPDETLEWDVQQMRFTNHEKASALVHHEYREGWEVEGL